MSYQLPLKGKITSKFGKRKHPVSHKQSFHNGVDISAPVGTEIQAPDSGRISEVWDHETGGKCIAMVGRTGIRFGFAHLSRQLKAEGDIVNIGDIIAESGNTGASTGPHVHFTVKVNNNWVNPETYFKF